MELRAEARTTLGKTVHRLRKDGFLPAELYGHGVGNRHLTVSKDGFLKVFTVSGEHKVITLVVGSEKVPVVVHDTQRDAISGDFTHVDFYQVRADEKITAKIPIEFTGAAPAEKEGAFVSKTLHEVEAEALPQDLPSKFTVDLSALREVPSRLYVKDLAVPKGVKIRLDPETVIVAAVPAKVEEVVAAPVDVSAVKVESEEKKAEREAEKTKEEKEEEK
jgi:large subunit ribosomal protein L25